MKKILITLDDDIAEMLNSEKNKSLVVRQALEKHYRMNGVVYVTEDRVIELIEEAISKKIALPSVNKPLEEEFVPKAPDPLIGYPCCLNEAPCKHWTWNGLDGVWKNTLTGLTRETNA